MERRVSGCEQKIRRGAALPLSRRLARFLQPQVVDVECRQPKGSPVVELLASLSRKGSRSALVALATLAALTGLLHSPGAAHEAAQADKVVFVLFSQGNQSTSMSGSTQDLRRAKALRAGDEALLYVREGGAAYVIRDAAVLRQAKAILQPQEALGARQGELGSRQAALGHRQAELGAEQARFGAQQARATHAQAVAIARRQEAVGRQQHALGQQQNALGKQQSALGREQERLHHEAQGKFRNLLAEALRRGVAKRVN
jgi:hypothetical protein